jgi:hypothetical protein
MTMNAVRLNVVRRAFESAGAGESTTLRELLSNYAEERHPLVAAGKVTPQDALADIVTMFGNVPDGEVTWDRFREAYEHVSRTVEDDGDFFTLVVRTWQLDQAVRGDKQLLAKEVAKGFRTSAYANNGRAPHDGATTSATHGVNIQRAQLAIDPLPFSKAGAVPKLAQGTFDQTSKTHHRVRTVTATKLAIPPPESHCMAGSTGLPGSFGFLNTDSSTQRATGTGELDPAVMEAYRRGKAAERDAAHRRAHLESAPFESADPAAYFRSSLAHTDLTGAVNRDRPAKPVADRSPRHVTDNELQQVLEEQRAAIRANITVSRPAKTCVQSSYQAHYTGIDTKRGVGASKVLAPAPNVHDSVPERRTQGYDTEYSTTMLNRQNETTRDPKYDCKGTFRLINGVPQMHPASHRPRDTRTGLPLSPTTVVPTQFETTNLATFR